MKSYPCIYGDCQNTLVLYTLQFSEGKLSAEDFKFNLRGLKGFCETAALQERSITQNKMDELRK